MNTPVHNISLTANFRMGGGKNRRLISKNHTKLRCKQFLWLFVPLFLCLVGSLSLSSCQPRAKHTICGVPVQGTPWELAAGIADHGDGTFHPVSVLDRIFTDKAYIEGFIYACTDAEAPRIIVCHLDPQGKVTRAYMVKDLSEECDILDTLNTK